MATVALGTVIRELIRGFYPQGSNPKAFPAIAHGFLELGPLRELETCAAEAETILRGISDELFARRYQPAGIDEYFETVVRIHAEGKTVLLIEQNAETALSIADRGYLLVRGRIAVGGTRAEMLRDDTIRHMYL
ncbi:hypothetical protein NM680_06000 [Paracoccus sp. PS-1]|uniref:hypothetical protein n=1 Tax=unclassified Paracoccus (in: a-proteobacteria) TaxID=2688777 RepID=UPI00048A821E|nr:MULTISPECIES: hypothetical protein [unclassified Paracoccus (in: a-proteobacteria)]MDQ7261353.1 hypothetical protein [Paracoccus sp. PS1]